VFTKKWIFFKVLLFWMLIITKCYALPFHIVPTTALPTTVYQGDTVKAYYTVTNNTLSTRANNFVEYLPPNVTQIVSAGPYSPVCNTTFTLAPSGSAGDSCILELLISGAVNGSDPNPTHQLFVCFPGGQTCAGTPFPLNLNELSAISLTSIALSPVSPTVSIGGTQQFIATGTYTDGSVSTITTPLQWTSSNPAIATVSATGLATGIASGTTNITAKQGTITSAPDVLSVPFAVVSVAVTPSTASMLYGAAQQFTATATFSNGSTGNVTSQAVWASSNPAIATINSAGVATGVSGIGSTNTTNITATVQGITSTTPAVATVTYYLWSATSAFDALNQPAISYCKLNPASGTTTGCAVANSTTDGLRSPNNAVVNNNSSILFATSSLNLQVMGCAITNNAGTISISTNCTTTNVANEAYGITLDQANTHAYLSYINSNTVQGCTISGSSLSCGTAVSSGGGTPEGIALNPANTMLYVATTGGIFQCPITSPGVIGTCVSTPGGSNPSAVAITPNGQFAFIGNGRSFTTQGTVTSCSVNSTTGAFSNCNTVIQNFEFTAGVFGVAIDPTGTYLFATDGNSVGYVCTISGANVSGCTSVGDDISGSFGITGLSVH
jgi:Bacterial Ig-like domain (group 2)